jgi:hypothetical protein
VTSTVFFRDDGTMVEVSMAYKSGQQEPDAQEYDQLLASLIYQ